MFTVSFQLIYRNRSHRMNTSVLKFAEKYRIGSPEFGNFYQAEYDSYCDELHAQFID